MFVLYGSVSQVNIDELTKSTRTDRENYFEKYFQRYYLVSQSLSAYLKNVIWATR